jgi:hypothetical protein
MAYQKKKKKKRVTDCELTSEPFLDKQMLVSLFLALSSASLPQSLHRSIDRQTDCLSAPAAADRGTTEESILEEKSIAEKENIEFKTRSMGGGEKYR